MRICIFHHVSFFQARTICACVVKLNCDGLVSTGFMNEEMTWFMSHQIGFQIGFKSRFKSGLNRVQIGFKSGSNRVQIGFKSF